MRSSVVTSLTRNFRYAQKADVTVFENYLHNKHDFSRLIYGEDNFEMMRLNMRNLDALARLTGRHVIDVERDMLRKNAGLLPTKVKIVSDGRTATVEPVVPSYDDFEGSDEEVSETES